MKTKHQSNNRSSLGILIGAAFIMATAAVGPGFLTQTSHYTDVLKGSFGFVIIVVCLLAMIVQLNTWRLVCASGLHGQEIAGRIHPILGHILSAAIGFGGIIFTIGNIGGGALGFNALTGGPSFIGGIITGAIAIMIFLLKNAMTAMDNVSKLIGLATIILIFVIILIIDPPVGTALKDTFMPSAALPSMFIGIHTILGGTVGGYTSFSGAHRLLDAGMSGSKFIKRVTQSSILGILLITLVRVLLFLAVFGVVCYSSSAILDSANPAADAFQLALGKIGYRIFGLILFSVSLMPSIACPYTTVSFLTSIHPLIKSNQKRITVGFIIACTIISCIIGRPAYLLLLAGVVNGFIIPLILVICLIASRRKDIVGEEYHHPKWLFICTIITAIITAFLAIMAVL